MSLFGDIVKVTFMPWEAGSIMGGGSGGGSSGGSSGGGGSSGKTDYPAYMKSKHGKWLNEVDSYIQSLKDNSPFAEAATFNPDDDLEVITSALDDFKSFAQGAAAQWKSSVSDSFVSNIKNLFLPDGTYMNAVSARLALQNDRMKGRNNAAMLDIGAVNSAAFAMANAFLDAESKINYAKVEADVAVSAVASAGNAAVDAIKQYNVFAFETERVLLSVVETIMKTKISAKAAQYDGDLKIDMLDATWPLDMYKGGGNVLASIAGAAVSQYSSHEAANKGDRSTLGTVLSGVGLALTASSMFASGPKPAG